MKDNDTWQPAVIADSAYTLRSHTTDPGQVTRFAGQRIRVRLSDEPGKQVGTAARLWLGCNGRHLEVHPEDAQRLWPDIAEEANVTVCDCELWLD
jgi:hypothetical protein